MIVKLFLQLHLIGFVVLHVKCANILAVYPFPSISHQVVFRRITAELLRRGHEVTVITPDPEYSKGAVPINLTEIDVRNVSYEAKDYVHHVYSIVGNPDAYSMTKVSKLSMTWIFEAQMKLREVQDVIFHNTKKFDLILLESMVRPSLAISHVIKAPVILVSSMGTIYNLNKIMGALTHPILYPSPFEIRIYNLTFWERLKNLYYYLLIQLDDYKVEERDNVMLRKYFGPDLPPLSELYNNAHMLFLNTHYIWADNQPVPPSVVYLGGLHRKEPKELPTDLKAYLDSSKHGVVYVSFGTNAVSTLIPKRVIKIIATVLSQLPYDILWKWDQDELPVKSKNIKTAQWFPQADLLNHQNIKLFITQGGLQSTDEAIIAGVPLIAIPMLADQSFNGEKYIRHDIGIKFAMDELEPETFKDAVEMIANDKKYRENIKRLSKVMQDEPEPPLERAMWWIEHVLRHGGGEHLRAPTANISWAQYYELNIILFVLSLLLISIFAFVIIIILIVKLLLKSMHSNYKIIKKKNK